MPRSGIAGSFGMVLPVFERHVNEVMECVHWLFCLWDSPMLVQVVVVHLFICTIM